MRRIAPLVLIAGLPFFVQALRYESHEAPRAGVLALVVLLALPTLPMAWQRADRAGRALLAGALVWCIALALAAVFSLSPARSVFGDPLRKMGLWTHLALVACLLLGAGLSPGRAWRWFWLAGVVVAAHTLLQAAGALDGTPERRPPGLFGSPTFTGGWLALALVWILPAILRERLAGWRRGAVYGGVGLMALALLLTETRGGMLALGAGGVTLGLVWMAAQRSRRGVRWLWRMGGTSLLLLAGFIALDTGNLLPENVPLLSRLRVFSYDQSLSFRQTTWNDAVQIARTWQPMTDIHGQVDAWSALRPAVGYGLESFFLAHQPLIGKDLHESLNGQRVDRAHNDWLDTLVMTGGLGVLARAGRKRTGWKRGSPVSSKIPTTSISTSSVAAASGRRTRPASQPAAHPAATSSHPRRGGGATTSDAATSATSSPRMPCASTLDRLNPRTSHMPASASAPAASVGGIGM